MSVSPEPFFFVFLTASDSFGEGIPQGKNGAYFIGWNYR
jgi:hypothetical protein